jgi:CRISPR-associated protein Cas5h
MVSGKSYNALKERTNSYNLVVREQWLENPKWKIIILDDNSINRNIFDKLKDYLLNSKAVFIPYLGKNDHPAKIENVEEIELEKIDFNGKIKSLFINKNFLLNSFPPRNEIGFLFKEVSPIKLKEKYHFYEYETLAYTNYKMDISSNENLIIYSRNEKNYFFF